MSKKTILKPITAMLLAFAMLLTGVVPGTLATAKAAEDGNYSVFEYQDADGNVIKTSEKIYEGETFELQQDARGVFKYFNASGELETSGTWSGVMKNNGSYGISGSNHSYVHRERASRFAENYSLLQSFQVNIVVDTTVLDNSLSSVEGMEQGTYTEDNWNALQTAVSSAKDLKDKITKNQTKSYRDAQADSITQSKVDDVTASLNTAILNLKKEDLQAVITAAEAVTNDDYTDASWTAFETAVSTAKELQTKEDVTTAEIEDAINAVNAAKDALAKKPAVVPAPATTTGKKNETTTAKKNETKPVKKYTVAKTTLKRAKKSGRKAQLTWKKVKAVTGYQVYQATKKNGKYKKIKTIKKNKVVTCKTKSLKRKKTYFFKVRTYRKVAGKTYYGAFSNVKRVVIK